MSAFNIRERHEVSKQLSSNKVKIEKCIVSYLHKILCLKIATSNNLFYFIDPVILQNNQISSSNDIEVHSYNLTNQHEHQQQPNISEQVTAN